MNQAPAAQFDRTALLARFDAVAAKVTAADARKTQRFTDVKKQRRLIHPLLYLLVEVKARELAAKAVIARQAAEQGLTVVIGATWAVTSLDLPPGIMFFKTMNHLDAYNMSILIRKGHQFAAMDEESFGIAAASRYIAATTHPYAAAFADVICAQGKSYAAAFPYPADVRVTGTARTQTYRPLTYRVSRGGDILVCLQSGNINNNGRSFEDMVGQSLQLSAHPLATAEGRAWTDITRASIGHECDMLPLVLGSIDALAAAFPDRRIVVRAHPVENPDTWTFTRPNIVRDTGDTIVAALEKAATLVYVSGCTTGLDAYLAGVPAVRLGHGGHGISAHMHAAAMTPQEAVAAVRRNETWRGDISGHLAPLDLVSHLLPLYRDNRASGPMNINTASNFTPVAFHHRKFPETSEAEMAALVGLPVKQIGWNTFLVPAVKPIE
jgi:surface carbohydrate biosynthesis protein